MSKTEHKVSVKAIAAGKSGWPLGYMDRLQKAIVRRDAEWVVLDTAHANYIAARAAHDQAGSPASPTTPGAFAEWLIHQIGFEMSPTCACRAKRNEMDRNGWVWCVRHSAEIIDWFVGQAKAHKVKLSRDDAVGLFKAGIKQFFIAKK